MENGKRKTVRRFTIHHLLFTIHSPPLGFCRESCLSLSELVIPRRLYRTPFHHEDDSPFRGSRTMNDASRYGIALMRFKRDRFAFEVNQKPSLQNEEEFVFPVMLVPVE